MRMVSMLIRQPLGLLSQVASLEKGRGGKKKKKAERLAHNFCNLYSLRALNQRSGTSMML